MLAMISFIINEVNITSDNLIIALVGYLIVFTALVVLYFVFQNIPKLIAWQTKRRLKKKGESVEKINNEHISIPGTVNAAISTALFLYMNELHDEEKTVITIKKVSKTYSPWNSKIYSMRWPLK